MEKNNKNKVLLLTLVHPDYLPPVYAIAQSLRDAGSSVHILTFDSFTTSDFHPGPGIVVESVGKHHALGVWQRLALRKKYRHRLAQLVAEGQQAIIACCVFTYLTALKERKSTTLAYHAIEIADFVPSAFMRSPLSNLNNKLALDRVHMASFVSTPSVQRSAWLAGRCQLSFMPHAIQNASYLPASQPGKDVEIFRRVVPEYFYDKNIVLYTGGVRPHLCIKELVAAFLYLRDKDSALVVTGLKDDEYSQRIKGLVAASDFGNHVLLLPYVSRAEMLSLQANAHVGVCLMQENDRDLESKMMAPNKVGEYLMRGLYVLGTDSVYMQQFDWMQVATLAKSVAEQPLAQALEKALQAVATPGYKDRITDCVTRYYNMQIQAIDLVQWATYSHLR